MKPKGRTYCVVETVKRTFKVTMSHDCALDAFKRGGKVEAIMRAAELTQAPTQAAVVVLVDTETTRDVIDMGQDESQGVQPFKIMEGRG